MTPLPLVVGVLLGVAVSLAPWLALGIAAYWVYLLYRRTFRSSEDPSYRKFSSSRLGSASFVISGVYLSAVIAVVLAVLTWPLVFEQRLVGGALVALVVFHAALEYQESQGAGS